MSDRFYPNTDLRGRGWYGFVSLDKASGVRLPSNIIWRCTHTHKTEALALACCEEKVAGLEAIQPRIGPFTEWQQIRLELVADGLVEQVGDDDGIPIWRLTSLGKKVHEQSR